MYFGALFESCERDNATTLLEQTEIQMGIAAVAAGGEGAWEGLQDRMDMYRFVLGLDPVKKTKGVEEFKKSRGVKVANNGSR